MSAVPAKDLLGHTLTATERSIVETYRAVLALLREDLPPCVEANVKEAAASLWQVVNDLALLDERPDV